MYLEGLKTNSLTDSDSNISSKLSFTALPMKSLGPTKGFLGCPTNFVSSRPGVASWTTPFLTGSPDVGRCLGQKASEGRLLWFENYEKNTMTNHRN